MGLFTNRPWINVYQREASGSRGSTKLELIIKLDVRLIKKDQYEYKCYANELVSGDYFKDVTLEWLFREDKDIVSKIIKEFNLK